MRAASQDSLVACPPQTALSVALLAPRPAHQARGLGEARAAAGCPGFEYAWVPPASGSAEQLRLQCIPLCSISAFATLAGLTAPLELHIAAPEGFSMRG